MRSRKYITGFPWMRKIAGRPVGKQNRMCQKTLHTHLSIAKFRQIKYYSPSS